MTEQFANNASTTLNGALDNVTTTVVLTNATPFSQTGTFRIIVDSEIMLVTAISVNTLTVARGQEATTAATHLNGATVTQIMTSGAIAQLKQDVFGIVWTATQTSAYTVLSSDQGVGVDTTSAAITITLPASPNDGERHLIADVAGTANTHNITVSGNGHNIIGLSTYIITGQYNVLEVAYHAGKGIWVIV